MKDTRWRTWEIISLFWTLAAGNLLHFVYDWTGSSVAAALFSAVNESTWEHMKLLAVPWILFSLVEYIVLRSGGIAGPVRWACWWAWRRSRYCFTATRALWDKGI